MSLGKLNKIRTSLRNANIPVHLALSLLTILISIALSQFSLDGLKGIFIDILFRLRWDQKADPRIALIAYDDQSSVRYFKSSKAPVIELEKVFAQLEADGPQAVALILPINEKTYTPNELYRLNKAVLPLSNLFIGYMEDTSLGKPAPPQFSESVRVLPGFVSRDNFSYGADSISRRVMVTVAGMPTIYAELARIAHESQKPIRFQHAHSFGQAGSQQVYINWQGPHGTYPIYSSQSVAEGKLKPGTFKDKLVLIGTTLTSDISNNYLLSPFNRNPLKMTTIEGAAQGLATLLNDNAIFKSSPWLDLALSIGAGLLTVNLVLLLTPVTGILFVFAELVLLFSLAWAMFVARGAWIDIAHPFIIACLGYYLVIPYRLVSEFRKRWHYQQKSEMMLQLEQLKSNFLNLVSHDLKTPIARIQGNAELLLSQLDSTEAKSQQYLKAIVDTTDGLGQYVETILDLTRIDSSKVALQKVTRDINSTITNVIESKKMMAADKNIRIESKLEPIFSIRFDVKLINRVLSNLVENAIRYSPEGTVITISSQEVERYIHVTVADQGIGISAEDQERIFTKFFRCENNLTKQVKGTGLGLYLVKYFVELHDGAVRLESRLNEGSKFTVTLPI